MARVLARDPESDRLGSSCGNGQPGSGSPRGRKCGERRITAFSPGPSRCSGLRPAGELGGRGTGQGLCLTRPPVGRVQAWKWPWTSSWSLPVRLDGDLGCLHGSPSTEAPATEGCAHCHSGNAFNQLQSLHSSFRNHSGLDELSNPGRSGLNCWDIACLYFGSTSVVRAVLRRAIIVNWELSHFVLATTCIPIDPVQRILSRLNEKSGGRRGPGCLGPSLMMAGWELGP